METKRCKACLVEKPLSEFYRSRKKGYYQARCKPCNIAQIRQYQSENPEGRARWGKAWRERHGATTRFRATRILENMISRSKQRGFDRPEWTREEIMESIEGGACAQTGIPFDFDRTTFARSPWTPVPDRINSTLGYTHANVQWVCLMFNSMKQEYTSAEVDRFVEALIQHRAEGAF
jgi:hypothetical protein